VSEAAHRTPPGNAGGTEINPSPCKVAFSAVDIIFLQQHEKLQVQDVTCSFFFIIFLCLLHRSFEPFHRPVSVAEHHRL